MAKTVTIELDEPIMGETETFSRIVLREPAFHEYMELGDIQTIMYVNGSPVVVENAGTLKAYLDKCIVEPANPHFLNTAGLKVAMLVRRSMIGFFRLDEAAAEA